jgi:hypothetical protein
MNFPIYIRRKWERPFRYPKMKGPLVPGVPLAVSIAVTTHAELLERFGSPGPFKAQP